MSQGRDEGGRFTGRIADEDVLAALRSHPDPVATAGDLAEVLDVTAETVRRHLAALHDRGAVGRKTVGARAVVWWVADENDDGSAPAAPLRDLVGLLPEEAAASARERSEEWREAFDREVDATGSDGS